MTDDLSMHRSPPSPIEFAVAAVLLPGLGAMALAGLNRVRCWELGAGRYRATAQSRADSNGEDHDESNLPGMLWNEARGPNAAGNAWTQTRIQAVSPLQWNGRNSGAGAGSKVGQPLALPVVRATMGHACAPHPSRGCPQNREVTKSGFPDGRPSRFVYWDYIPGRRLRTDLADSAVAERVAKIFARAEQRMLDLQQAAGLLS